MSARRKSSRFNLALALALLGQWTLPTGPVHAEGQGGLLGLPSKPNIVLITVDTLRADHVSVYGYERQTTPVIDEMSRNGVRFVNAVSQAPWTLPSIASIHTGLYPTEHGATHSTARVSDQAATIAEVLRAAGYRTLGVVGHDFAGSNHGLAQGFDFFDESAFALAHEAATSQQIIEIALAGVSQKSDRPFFLWVHLFDPHFNWVRHPRYAFADEFLPQLLPGAPRETVTVDFLGGRGRNPKNRRLITTAFKDFVRAVYDEEIAHTDHWIGKLMEGIGSLGHAESTVTFLTADHGEFFWERGRMFHEGEVYRELVHVPLIMSGPIDRAFRSHRVLREVELVSLPRTIAEIAGVDDHGFGGENLARLPTGVEKPRLAFSEGNYAFQPAGKKRAVFYGGWKLIQRVDAGSYELYRTTVDPGEKANLWGSQRPDVAKMRTFLTAELERFVAERRPLLPQTESDLGPEERERLKALGYLE